MDPAAAAPRHPYDAFPGSVQPVCRWAFANALAFILHSGGMEPKASSGPGRWMPWLTAAEAAAAGLALLLLPLPGTGRRRSLLLFLTSAALAATIANHVMYAWLADLAVAADPAGHLHLFDVAPVAVRFFGMADVIALLTLMEGDLGAAFHTFLSRSVFLFLTGEVIAYYI
jgi:hypothetical protein